jgi:hypothetical protein
MFGTLPMKKVPKVGAGGYLEIEDNQWEVQI